MASEKQPRNQSIPVLDVIYCRIDWSAPDCVPVAVAQTPDTSLTLWNSPKSTRMSEDFQDVVFFWADGDELKAIISNEFQPEIPKHVSGHSLCKYDEEID